MARMRPTEFPLDDDYHEESREKEAFGHLSDNLPEQDIVIYEPRLFGKHGCRKPDFVLFSPDYGCVVLEVKNWNFEKIVGLTDDGRNIEWENGEKTPNPYTTAENYMYALFWHLKTRSDNEKFIIQDGERKGRINFHVCPAVALLGLQDSDLSSVAEKLGLDPQFLVSEETLADTEKLKARLCNLPKVHPEFGDLDTLKAAADMLIPASDKEKTNEEVRAAIERLQHADFNPEIEQLEKCEAYMDQLADAGYRIAEWINSEELEKEDEEESADKVLSNHADELKKIASDLAQRRFRVCFFGTTGAGKSTLTNALVGGGRDILREGMGRTTRVITCIKNCIEAGEVGEKKRLPLSTDLLYKTEKQVNEEIEKYLNCLGLSKGEMEKIHLDDPQFRNWLKTQIDSNQKGIAPQEATDSARALEHFLEGWDMCRDSLGRTRTFDPEEFKKSEALIHTPHESHACYVKQRIIYHDHELTTERGFELIDAPGVGASIADTEQTLEFAQEADAVVIVTKVGFDFMQPDREFLNGLRDILPRDLVNRKLIFVLNQITHNVKPRQCGVETFGEALDFVVDRLRNSLREFGIEEVLILATDAFCAKVSKRCIVAEKENAVTSDLMELYDEAKFARIEDYKENLKESRFQELQEGLVQRLVTLKYAGPIDTGLFRIEREVEHCVKTVSERLLAFSKSIDDLKEELRDHREKKDHTEIVLEGFLVRRKRKIEKRIQKEVLRHKLNELLDETKHKLLETLRFREFWDGVDEALNNTKEFVHGKIRGLREQSNAIWEEEKANLVENGIPDIVKQYGGKMEWSLNLHDLEEEQLRAIDALHDLKPGWWQWVKAKLRDLNPFDKGEKDILIEYVGEGYEEKIRNSFRDQIEDWVHRDQEGFREQIVNHINILAARIEEEIRIQMLDQKKTESDRKELTAKLKAFKDFSQEVYNGLNEIREEIERHRPFAEAAA